MPDYLEDDYKLRTLKVSAVAIATVVIVEVILGLFVDSLAILSDGLHASLDVITSVMLFMATRQALKPPDEEHTYGHEKFEPIGGLTGGIVLIGVGGLVIYEAVSKLMQGGGVNTGLGLAGFFAIGYTFCIDIFRMYIFRKATSSKSSTVKAGLYHAAADLSSTAIAFLGFGLANVGFYQGDSFSSIVLGILLGYMSVRLVRSSIMELSDTASKELVHKTRKVILYHDGVLDCRNLKVRKVGPKTFAECSVQVSSVMRLEEAHALASDIEDDLAKTFGDVDATIHIEPAEEETRMEQLVEKLAIVEGVKEVHNIVTVYARGKLYITLHVYVDQRLSVEEAHEIAEKIENRMRTGIEQLENVTIHVEPFGNERLSAEIDEDEMKKLIHELAKKTKTSLHLKRTVTYGAHGKRYINIDCCFTKYVPLTEAHEIASRLEREIAEYFADTVVTVHIEPEFE
ncbi:MAG: cation-efflux pump [Candidatus Bathyarchaeota archaeon]|nr:cation-efflux pump [Candidatus Bathyarchaeota archaeon]